MQIFIIIKKQRSFIVVHKNLMNVAVNLLLHVFIHCRHLPLQRTHCFYMLLKKDFLCVLLFL